MLQSLAKPINVSNNTRFIGSFEGKTKGPTVIFFGGIHGNEPAGVQALEHVFSSLHQSDLEPKGAVFGIRGNIPALLQKKRYIENDLNRLWSTEQLTEIVKKGRTVLGSEEKELLEIKQIIEELLRTRTPPFYFIDFHTTSSKTLPFITINDALINRKFSRQFPVPIILGIEEYLEGPLLSRMNQLGYVSLGFESGQHEEGGAVTSSIAFFWLTMAFTKLVDKKHIVDFDFHYNQLSAAAKGDSNFYEVIHRQELKNTDTFHMEPGFKSFQKVGKETLLGTQNGDKIHTKKNTILFMPLYQKQGAEGFFLIKNTPKWALKFSAVLRKSKLDSLLTLLPGIQWSDSKKESLLVNLRVARFFTISFFHLLGYRNRQVDQTHMIMHNRERTAKNKMYRQEEWY
jgi:hypothetical protein